MRYKGVMGKLKRIERKAKRGMKSHFRKGQRIQTGCCVVHCFAGLNIWIPLGDGAYNSSFSLLMVCLILMSQKGLDSSLKRLLSMLGIKYQDLLCNPRFQDFKAKRCRHRPQMGTIIHALKCMPHMLFQCTKVTCDVVGYLQKKKFLKKDFLKYIHIYISCLKNFFDLG